MTAQAVSLQNRKRIATLGAQSSGMPRRPTELRIQTILVCACLVLVGLWLATGASALSSHRVVASHPLVAPSPIRRVFERDLDVLADDLARLDTALAASRIEDARRAYLASRSAFKRTEALLAFYTPTTVAALNGPAEEESSDDAPQPLGRQGAFQTIEATLFDTTDATPALDDARRAAAVMRTSLASFRSATVLLDVSDSASLDAARLEVARVTTLGLAGFDTNLPERSIVECADALDGLRATLAALNGTSNNANVVAARRAIDVALDSAVRVLRAEPRPDHFDHVRFIARYATPAAAAILAMRRLIDSSPVHARRAWRPSSATPYARDAFDPSAFAPEYAPATSAALVELGEHLFNDTRLSGPQTRSCASCHIAAVGFADGLRHATALSGDSASSTPLRNTPTLWNVALQPFLFADQRAGSLEQQVGVVLASRAEMGSSAVLAAERVQRDTAYIAMLSRASARCVAAPAAVARRADGSHGARGVSPVARRARLAVRPCCARRQRGADCIRATRVHTIHEQRPLRHVSLRAAVQRCDAAGLLAVGARDRRSAARQRAARRACRSGFRARPRRWIRRARARVQGPDAPERRADRAVHAQRRVRNAR